MLRGDDVAAEVGRLHNQPLLATQVVEQRQMRQATHASLSVALSLAALKAGAAWWTGSISLWASMVDSSMDSLASLVTLVAVRASLEPADHEHRFGHGKLEPLAGLAQSVLVFGSAAALLWTSVQRLRHPEPLQATGIGVAVMLIASAATLGLVRYQKRVIAQTRSTAISADSLHFQSDLLMNAVVLVSLLLTAVMGWQLVDPLLGLCVAVLVARSAWRIAQDAVQLLMDREFPDADRLLVARDVLSHPEVKGIHDLRTRQSGTQAFVQFHIELDAEMSLRKAHLVTDAVEASLRQRYPHAEILIHVDPEDHPPDGPRIVRDSDVASLR